MFNLEESINNLDPNILYVFNSNYNGSTEVPTSCYHDHDFLELSILTTGYSNYNVENKFLKVVPGQVLILNPNIHHEQFMDKDVHYSDLHIGITNIKLHKNKNDFINLDSISSPLTMSKYREDFTRCCYDIVREQNEKNLGYALTLKSLVMKLIVIILRELYNPPKNDFSSVYLSQYTEKHHIVDSIITFMHENYMNDISLDKISKNMYLSPVYISKLFKEETGDSPINYLIKIRLDKATIILKSKLYSIKEVAIMVGYNDVYHFSKQFKKHYGFSPSTLTKNTHVI